MYAVNAAMQDIFRKILSILVPTIFIEAMLQFGNLTETLNINYCHKHPLKDYLTLKLNIKAANPHLSSISFLIIVFFERHC